MSGVRVTTDRASTTIKTTSVGICQFRPPETSENPTHCLMCVQQSAPREGLWQPEIDNDHLSLPNTPVDLPKRPMMITDLVTRPASCWGSFALRPNNRSGSVNRRFFSITVVTWPIVDWQGFVKFAQCALLWSRQPACYAFLCVPAWSRASWQHAPHEFYKTLWARSATTAASQRGEATMCTGTKTVTASCSARRSRTRSWRISRSLNTSRGLETIADRENAGRRSACNGGVAPGELR